MKMLCIDSYHDLTDSASVSMYYASLRIFLDHYKSITFYRHSPNAPPNANPRVFYSDLYKKIEDADPDIIYFPSRKYTEAIFTERLIEDLKYAYPSVILAAADGSIGPTDGVVAKHLNKLKITNEGPVISPPTTASPFTPTPNSNHTTPHDNLVSDPTLSTYDPTKDPDAAKMGLFYLKGKYGMDRGFFALGFIDKELLVRLGMKHGLLSNDGIIMALLKQVTHQYVRVIDNGTHTRCTKHDMGAVAVTLFYDLEFKHQPGAN